MLFSRATLVFCALALNWRFSAACDCDLTNTSGRSRTEFELCWLLQRYNLGHLEDGSSGSLESEVSGLRMSDAPSNAAQINSSLNLQAASVRQMLADLRLLGEENAANRTISNNTCRQPMVPATYQSNQLLLSYFAWLLYQIVTRSCTANELQQMVLTINETASHAAEASCSGLLCDWSLLLWANIAGVAIGAGGFLAVLVVKGASRTAWFGTLQQFLIAAAVSTLCGDAMLHLIPHAMADQLHAEQDVHAESEEGHEHGDHKMAVWHGVSALCGIFLFLLLGRCSELFRLLTSTSPKSRQSRPSSLPIDSETGSPLASGVDQAELGLALEPPKQSSQRPSTSSSMSAAPLLSNQSKNMDTIKEDDSQSDAFASPEHDHGHGHSHQVKGDLNDMKTLISTVVIGDALHNFCDGLVIGVGFASGKLGGLSTAIAVFCHELPHELGDFAFLLHCGMTVRNALLCNAISALVSMVGVWAGLLLDQVFASLATWVYMFTAGMFFYIGLAAMIPQLTLSDASKSIQRHSNVASRFVAQIAGLLFGATVMICIALYEDQLADALQGESD